MSTETSGGQLIRTGGFDDGVLRMAMFMQGVPLAKVRQCATDAGLVVPKDIALAGFDDIPLARYVPPGLTTMRVDIAALGADAMRRLLATAGDGPFDDGLRPPRLVVRGSTGGARASPNSS